MMGEAVTGWSPCALDAGQEHDWSLTLSTQAELVLTSANREFVPGQTNPHKLETCRSRLADPLKSHPLDATRHGPRPPLMVYQTCLLVLDSSCESHHNSDGHRDHQRSLVAFLFPSPRQLSRPETVDQKAAMDIVPLGPQTFRSGNRD